MGKVGPNPQTNDHSSLVMDLVRSEDKTTNHSDPTRAQTCVILVIEGNMMEMTDVKYGEEDETMMERDGMQLATLTIKMITPTKW